MAHFNSRVLVGVLLVLGGLFLLAQSLGYLSISSPAVLAVVFVLAGVAFFALLLSGDGEWWPVIPGFLFLAIGSVLGLSTLTPGVPSNFTGGLFLGLLGLAFVSVYLLRPLNWWAIIPGGVLLTLAVLATLGPIGRRGGDSGAILFLGLGITFLVVYLTPNPRGRMTWALYPAGAMLLLALVVGVGSAPALNVVWPALLIAAGAYLMLRATRSRRL